MCMPLFWDGHKPAYRRFSNRCCIIDQTVNNICPPITPHYPTARPRLPSVAGGSLHAPAKSWRRRCRYSSRRASPRPASRKLRVTRVSQRQPSSCISPPRKPCLRQWYGQRLWTPWRVLKTTPPPTRAQRAISSCARCMSGGRA